MMNKDYDYIAQGDCVELMKEIPNDFIDLTVTSPPYDNLRDYNNEVTWNFEVFKEVAKELFRITKPGGVVVWVVGDATVNGSETGTSFRQALYFKDVCGFNLHDTMIYKKHSQYPPNRRYWQCFEYMFVFSKGKPKTFNPLMQMKKHIKIPSSKDTYRQKDGSLKTLNENAMKRFEKAAQNNYRIADNIWEIQGGYMSSTKDKYAFKHPAVFPEKLVQNHILTWSNPGDIVFDPFLGSGTTAKMAVLTDRHYIGFEISKEYFDIACQRLDDVESKQGVKDNADKRQRVFQKRSD